MVIVGIFLGSVLCQLQPCGLAVTLGIAIKSSGADLPTPRPHAQDSNPIMSLTYYTPSFLQPPYKRRNINLLSIGVPCPKAQLSLGTANPPMIDIAEETLGFRRSGLSPDLRLLIPTFSLPSAPACFTTRLHSYIRLSAEAWNAPLPLMKV